MSAKWPWRRRRTGRRGRGPRDALDGGEGGAHALDGRGSVCAGALDAVVDAGAVDVDGEERDAPRARLLALGRRRPHAGFLGHDGGQELGGMVDAQPGGGVRVLREGPGVGLGEAVALIVFDGVEDGVGLIARGTDMRDRAARRSAGGRARCRRCRGSRRPSCGSGRPRSRSCRRSGPRCVARPPGRAGRRRSSPGSARGSGASSVTGSSPFLRLRYGWTVPDWIGPGRIRAIWCARSRIVRARIDASRCGPAPGSRSGRGPWWRPR
jgi:hypothetical protein